MKNLLLILLFLIIQPVSNEQIQQNIGFQQPQIVQYQQQPEYFTSSAKAQNRSVKSITVQTVTGPITIWYEDHPIGLKIIDSGGLNLSGIYLHLTFQSAIYRAVEEYNKSFSTPIEDPIICLLLFGSLYLICLLYNNKKYVWKQ